MIEKLQIIQQRFDEVSDLIIQPDVITDQKRYIQLNKEYKELSVMVEKMNQYKIIISNLEEAELLLKDEQDEEMIAMAKMEIESAKENLPKLEEEIKFLLIPKDPEDAKNVVVEIRAGTGGDEASIFAGDLYRMYTKYCQSQNWQVSFVDSSEGTAGGFKEVIFEVSGDDVYGTLKYESGVHRVQRVPTTESGGRVHTSAATVAVLPEAEDVDIHIETNDIRIDTMRASGAGGQHVNTTDSAVRITHLPTGLIVVSSEKSQHRNREIAMQVLKTRLYDLERARVDGERSADRKSQVGSGDRSERIRTYNFPQGRMTDHRIGLTLYRLDQILHGDLGEIIDALTAEAQAKLLAEISA